MNNEVKRSATDKIEIRRVFKCTKEKLWQYLTLSDYRKQWLCSGIVASDIGGDIEFDFDHKKYLNSSTDNENKDRGCVNFKGNILEFDPPNQLKFNWPSEPGKPDTIVTISLNRVDEGVELHLIHELIQVASHLTSAATGWHTHIDLLSDIISGISRRDFWLRHHDLEKVYIDKFK